MPPPAEGTASRLLAGPTLRAQPDRRLVTLVREGYEVAFEEIVRRYGRALTRYAAAIVGGRSEDVTQDALSKALLALRQNDAEIELRPWLFRIVRNTALNDLRDRPPEAAALAEAIAAGSGDPAAELERREELADLIGRLHALPEAQRAAIVMRELEGLSHDEIAAALGLSGGAARQAIYRARQALRDGAALLMPLPVVRMLIEHGGEAGAGVGAGVGAGGAAVASGALGGAGASGALKIGLAAAVLAGSVGTGVALKEEGRPNRTAAASAAGAPLLPAPPAPPPGAVPAAVGGELEGAGDSRARLRRERRRRAERREVRAERREQARERSADARRERARAERRERGEDDRGRGRKRKGRDEDGGRKRRGRDEDRGRDRARDEDGEGGRKRKRKGRSDGEAEERGRDEGKERGRERDRDEGREQESEPPKEDKSGKGGGDGSGGESATPPPPPPAEEADPDGSGDGAAGEAPPPS